MHRQHFENVNICPKCPQVLLFQDGERCRAEALFNLKIGHYCNVYHFRSWCWLNVKCCQISVAKHRAMKCSCYRAWRWPILVFLSQQPATFFPWVLRLLFWSTHHADRLHTLSLPKTRHDALGLFQFLVNMKSPHKPGSEGLLVVSSPLDS